VISTLVFIFYFTAAGFILSELGVPIRTYFASASIIGLAVGFGSEGMVQDIVSGLASDSGQLGWSSLMPTMTNGW
jgi:small conductance mechanosensitive channel